jgi:hypothetical protein
MSSIAVDHRVELKSEPLEPRSSISDVYLRRSATRRKRGGGGGGTGCVEVEAEEEVEKKEGRRAQIAPTPPGLSKKLTGRNYAQLSRIHARLRDNRAEGTSGQVGWKN